MWRSCKMVNEELKRKRDELETDLFLKKKKNQDIKDKKLRINEIKKQIDMLRKEKQDLMQEIGDIQATKDNEFSSKMMENEVMREWAKQNGN